MVKFYFVAVCALVVFMQSNARNMPTTTLSDKTPTTVDVATTVRSGGAGFKEEKTNFIPFPGVGLATNLGEDIGTGGSDGADGAGSGLGGAGGAAGGGACGGAGGGAGGDACGGSCGGAGGSAGGGACGGTGGLGGDVDAVKGGVIDGCILDP